MSVLDYGIRVAAPTDVGALSDVFRRASLSNDGDRDALLANPDALVFDEASVHEQRTRVAIVADGVAIYNNRAVLMADIAWGKIRGQEDYEDTQRVHTFDQDHPERAGRPITDSRWARCR